MTGMILRLMLVLSLGWPRMVGLATHYNCQEHCGRQTRSEEMYAPDAPTCAVDAGVYQELAGRQVWVMAYRPDLAQGYALESLRVNDSGKLERAGRFAPQGRGWTEATVGERIVLDVPEETFRLLSPDGETVQVAVWIR